MKTSLILSAAVTALSLGGCMSTTPYWDSRFGEAVRNTTAQQIINPDASLNPDPVTGIDGKAAAGAMGEYHKGFTAPEPEQSVFTIGVGSGR